MTLIEEQLLKEIDQLKDQMIHDIQEVVKVKSVAGQPKEGAPYG